MLCLAKIAGKTPVTPGLLKRAGGNLTDYINIAFCRLGISCSNAAPFKQAVITKDSF
jgi:hypothetical protein